MYIVYQCYADMKDKAVNAAKSSRGAFFLHLFLKKMKKMNKNSKIIYIVHIFFWLYMMNS